MNESAKVLLYAILMTFFAVIIFNYLPSGCIMEYKDRRILYNNASRAAQNRHEKQIRGASGFSGVCAGAFLFIFLSGLADKDSVCEIWICFFAGCVMMVVCMSDIAYMIIPNEAVAALILIAFAKMVSEAVLPFSDTGDIYMNGSVICDIIADSCQGFFVAFALSWLTALLSGLISGGQAVGGGDIKLTASLGMLTGSGGAIFIMCGAAVMSAVSFSLQLFTGIAKREEVHPYAPYLCIATALYLNCI